MQDGAEQAGNDIQNAINNMRNSLEEWYKKHTENNKESTSSKDGAEDATIQAVNKTIQAAKMAKMPFQAQVVMFAKTPTLVQPVQVVLVVG